MVRFVAKLLYDDVLRALWKYTAFPFDGDLFVLGQKPCSLWQMVVGRKIFTYSKEILVHEMSNN